MQKGRMSRLLLSLQTLCVLVLAASAIADGTGAVLEQTGIDGMGTAEGTGLRAAKALAANRIDVSTLQRALEAAEAASFEPPFRKGSSSGTVRHATSSSASGSHPRRAKPAASAAHHARHSSTSTSSSSRKAHNDAASAFPSRSRPSAARAAAMAATIQTAAATSTSGHKVSRSSRQVSAHPTTARRSQAVNNDATLAVDDTLADVSDDTQTGVVYTAAAPTPAAALAAAEGEKDQDVEVIEEVVYIEGDVAPDDTTFWDIAAEGDALTGDAANADTANLALDASDDTTAAESPTAAATPAGSSQADVTVQPRTASKGPIPDPKVVAAVTAAVAARRAAAAAVLAATAPATTGKHRSHGKGASMQVQTPDVYESKHSIRATSSSIGIDDDSSERRAQSSKKRHQQDANQHAAVKKVAHAFKVSPKTVERQTEIALMQQQQLQLLAEQHKQAVAALRRQKQQEQQQQQQEAQFLSQAIPQHAVSSPVDSDELNKQKKSEQQQEQQLFEEEDSLSDQQEQQLLDSALGSADGDIVQEQTPGSESEQTTIGEQQEEPQEGSCIRPLLQSPFFNRNKAITLNNVYLAMLTSRYTYPTAFGINVDTNSSRLTYEELFRRKWVAMGAKANTIRFADTGGGPGSKLKRIFNAHKPEAHAVVLGTDKDVWIAFRGLTSVDSAFASDMRHSPTEALFDSKKVTVHSGFYNGFRELWPQVIAHVKYAIMQTEDPRQAKIYITGHSLGGAHALFTALKLSEMKLKNIGGVYLFGTPKIGQAAFLELFQESGLEPITSHWWNELDMVPNLGTAGPWKLSHYESLPHSTLYRIWDGKCGHANAQTAQACPLGPRKCRKNVNDHRAFSYVAKLQACVLQQSSIAQDKCLNSKVMTSM